MGRFLGWGLPVFLFFAGAARAAPEPGCLLAMVPDSVVQKHLRDFASDVSITLHGDTLAYTVSVNVFLKAVAGDLRFSVVDGQESPFEAQVRYSVLEGRPRAKIEGISVSRSAAARIVEPRVRADGERALSLTPPAIDPGLRESWVAALAELYMAAEFETGLLDPDRLNAWDRAALARSWLGEEGAALAIGTALWERVRGAHDQPRRIARWLGLAAGAEAAFHTDGKTPAQTAGFFEAQLRSREGASDRMDRGIALAALAAGDARRAFLRLGARAALLSVLERLLERNECLRTARMEPLLQKARTQHEEAYQDLARHFDSGEPPTLHAQTIPPSADASDFN